jgi:hypothetical protein
MVLLPAAAMVWLAAAPSERPALVVQAPDCPVRIDRASILAGAEGPPIVLYSATNLTDQQLEQFTIIAFIFDAEGTLKARQMAPARRTLEARETKYSTLVLDGYPVGPTEVLVIGVNQALRAGSEVWWRADLQPAAEAASRKKKP